MALFEKSLWPNRQVRPLPRMAVAVVLAPILLTTCLTAIAFVTASLSEPTRAGAMAVTELAASRFLAISTGFTATAGIAGVALLWAFAKRRITAWALAGFGLGGGMTIALSILASARVVPLQAGIGVTFGMIIFLLIRGLAGIRAR